MDLPIDLNQLNASEDNNEVKTNQPPNEFISYLDDFIQEYRNDDNSIADEHPETIKEADEIQVVVILGK